MTLRSDRGYGIEIEFFLKRGWGRMQGRQYVNDLLPQYGLAGWRCKYDISVNYEGLELVSPILYGEDGLRQLKTACKMLKDIEAKVDKSCGIHVHHDAREAEQRMGVTFFKKLYYIYWRFEGTIDSMMPESRRGNNNKYCRSVRTELGPNLKKFKGIKAMSRLKNFFLNTPMPISQRDWKYCKLNWTSFNRLGSVEFRQHSGSVEYNKLKHWIIFTSAIINRAAEDKNLFIPNNSTDNWERLNGCIDLPEDTKKYYLKRIKRFAEQEQPARQTA